MMEIISKSRGGGKTTELLKLASKTGGYNLIVCLSLREVQKLWNIIRENKYDLPIPITFVDFVYRRYEGRNVDNIFIDNADLLLQSMSSSSIGGITINIKKGEKKE